jgi:hypothetical protein
VILGGIPIYVDEEYRDEVIPQGTQIVEQFYDIINKGDIVEPMDKEAWKHYKRENPNFFVK